MSFVKYRYPISRLFTSSALRELASKGVISQLDNILKELKTHIETKDKTYSEIFEWFYNFLLKHYRCEYVYKNAIANKILLGRHSLITSTFLTELRVNTSKADVVILNGSSCVYEIKSEYDSLERLESQLKSYMQMFDEIYVVTSRKMIDKVYKVVPESVGLIELTDNYSLRPSRKSFSHKEQVNPAVIFDTLRIGEYKKIVKEQFGTIPDVPNTHIYTECKKLFTKLSPIVAHDSMVKILKQRQLKLKKEFHESIPPSLKAAFLELKLNLKQHENLSKRLQSLYKC